MSAQMSDTYRGIRRAGVEEYQASLLKRDVHWEEVEGAYVRQVLREPLRWLGLVDLGLDAAQRVVGLRITPLGRAVLTGGATIGPAGSAVTARTAGPRLVVQPNFEIIVLDVGGSLDLMARLDQFAVQRTIDRAAVYHLTREALVGALQAGARLAEIERLLEEEGGTPLPQNIRYSLSEWARQFERVTVRRAATLLEADSADQLDRWLADRETAALLGSRLSPTVVLVPAGRAEALASRLARRGSLALERATPPPPGSLKVRDDGLLQAKPETLGRFEEHRLRGFAERVTSEARTPLFRVTADSLAGARAAGWTAGAVLALLQARLGGEPPHDLALMVRGWLGEFAPAQQAAVRLVRLPDPAVWPLLERAAADGGLVARVAPALAVVDEAGLARVSEVLSARGIRVEATLPEVAAAPLLAPARAAGAAPDLGELRTLRGRALRDFLQTAITTKRSIVIMHQAGNQKTPKRHVVKPHYVDRRPSGHYLVAGTDQGTERSFKLDDIFGVALEEKT
jgi:hypothetical protein